MSALPPHNLLGFRAAVSDDAALLSSLAIRSKAHWGYSPEFMAAAVDELSVSATDIRRSDYHCVLAMLDSTVAGFYVLENLAGDDVQLGSLFVDSEYIGTGIGRSLIDQAKSQAVGLGAKTLHIVSDPNAADFYRAMGAIQSGSKESGSIAGRFLPCFEMSLENMSAGIC